MKSFLVYLQALLLAFPAHASLSPHDRVLRMGVLRYLEEPNLVGHDSHQHFEKRLGRWLENFESLSIHAESLPPKLKMKESVERGCTSLRGTIAGCQKTMTLGRELSAWKASCQGLAEEADEASNFGICGKEAQKALVLQSLLLGLSGDRAGEQVFLKKAISLHPDALLASPFEGEGEPAGFDAAKFWGKVKDFKETLVRDCGVDLLWGPFDEVDVNGFSVMPTPHLQLHRRGKWIIRAQQGKVGLRGIASCGSPGQLRGTLDLKKEDAQWALKSHLASVAEDRNLDFMIVVRPTKEQVRLFLFRRVASVLEEIPLERPIFVKDWERERNELRVPVTQESLVALLTAEPSQIKAAEVSPRADGPYDFRAVTSDLPPMLMAGLEGRTQKWYNNSTFWWVTAGLAVGIASVILISQNGQVRPNPTVRLELP